MTALRRVVGVATSLGVALAGLTSCTASDRALLTAPRCSDATAEPTVEQHQPGQAVLMSHVTRSSLRAGPIPGWEQVVSVADGRSALAAVHPDGTVSVVGFNHKGSLAGVSGADEEILFPQAVPGVRDAVSVAAVGTSFFVTHSDGTVTAWGDRGLTEGGRLQPRPGVRGPTRVDGVEGVVSIADGALNVLALRSDGELTGWGTNQLQLLGEPNDTGVRQIDDAPGAISIANSEDAAIVATGAGEVCAWGSNAHGLLGVEPLGGKTPRPVRVAEFDDIVQVGAGGRFALALDSSGRVWVWGRMVAGRAGDGRDEQTASLSTPTLVPGLPPLQRVYASDSASYGIDHDGGLWAWGGHRRVEPYETADLRPRLIPLPGPAQEISGNVALLGPQS